MFNPLNTSILVVFTVTEFVGASCNARTSDFILLKVSILHGRNGIASREVKSEAVMFCYLSSFHVTSGNPEIIYWYDVVPSPDTVVRNIKKNEVCNRFFFVELIVNGLNRPSLGCKSWLLAQVPSSCA